MLKDEGGGRCIDSIFLTLISQQVLDGVESENENIHVLFFLLFKAACDRQIQSPAFFYYREKLFLGDLGKLRHPLDKNSPLTDIKAMTLFNDDEDLIALWLVDFYYVRGEEGTQCYGLLSSNTISVGANTISVYGGLSRDTV